MGKRSNFTRKERDYYPTPKEAVIPLARFIDGTSFAEPCAGDGRLVKHLEELAPLSRCTYKADIEPDRTFDRDIDKKDAFHLTDADLGYTQYIITNPPWDRKILHPLIYHFVSLRPTWLLFDADWMHTKQSAGIVKQYLTKVVSVGRVKWIEGSKMTGKDNVCWYLFYKNKYGPTVFFGR